MCLSKPKAPPPPPAPTPVAPVQFADAEITEAGERARRRYGNARGRRSTILTGPQGVLDEAPAATRTLLGG